MSWVNCKLAFRSIDCLQQISHFFDDSNNTWFVVNALCHICQTGRIWSCSLWSKWQKIKFASSLNTNLQDTTSALSLFQIFICISRSHKANWDSCYVRVSSRSSYFFPCLNILLQNIIDLLLFKVHYTILKYDEVMEYLLNNLFLDNTIK